ncbi:hypothetical protein XENTR_v10018979 [Xenopus tropicalis]|nr:hypothetical protein XENTR_v10018979 [Xenopus tropicalis]
MCSQLWLLTDRHIQEDYPQMRILEALKKRCADQKVDFTFVLMDQIALTVTDGKLGLQINQKTVTAYPQVILVRVPTPTVQSDSDITVLRHLEKLGCRLVNRPQAILNCINKFWTFQELAGHDIPLPDTFSYGGHDEFSKMIDAAEPLGYPVVVKNTRGHREVCKGVSWEGCPRGDSWRTSGRVDVALFHGWQDAKQLQLRWGWCPVPPQ